MPGDSTANAVRSSLMSFAPTTWLPTSLPPVPATEVEECEQPRGAEGAQREHPPQAAAARTLVRCGALQLRRARGCVAVRGVDVVCDCADRCALPCEPLLDEGTGAPTDICTFRFKDLRVDRIFVDGVDGVPP